MIYNRVVSIILVLLHRVATRAVVFNYNTDIATIEEDIDTFIDDTEHLDVVVRLFLEGVKHDIGNGKEVLSPISSNFNEKTSRSLRIFHKILSQVEEEEDEEDEVKIIKMWRLDDFQ